VPVVIKINAHGPSSNAPGLFDVASACYKTKAPGPASSRVVTRDVPSWKSKSKTTTQSRFTTYVSPRVFGGPAVSFNTITYYIRSGEYALHPCRFSNISRARHMRPRGREKPLFRFLRHRTNGLCPILRSDENPQSTIPTGQWRLYPPPRTKHQSTRSRVNSHTPKDSTLGQDRNRERERDRDARDSGTCETCEIWLVIELRVLVRRVRPYGISTLYQWLIDDARTSYHCGNLSVEPAIRRSAQFHNKRCTILSPYLPLHSTSTLCLEDCSSTAQYKMQHNPDSSSLLPLLCILREKQVRRHLKVHHPAYKPVAEFSHHVCRKRDQH
jgi:hypothetical protein